MRNSLLSTPSQRLFDVLLVAFGFAGRAAGRLGAAVSGRLAAALRFAQLLGSTTSAGVLGAFDSGHGASMERACKEEAR